MFYPNHTGISLSSSAASTTRPASQPLFGAQGRQWLPVAWYREHRASGHVFELESLQKTTSHSFRPLIFHVKPLTPASSVTQRFRGKELPWHPRGTVVARVPGWFIPSAAPVGSWWYIIYIYIWVSIDILPSHLINSIYTYHILYIYMG